MPLTGRFSAFVVVAALAGVLATGAAAQGSPPIEQYVEQVPSGKGNKAVVGKGGTISKPRAPSTRRKVTRTQTSRAVPPRQREQRKAEDQILDLVAGSPNYGAPPRRKQTAPRAAKPKPARTATPAAKPTPPRPAPSPKPQAPSADKGPDATQAVAAPAVAAPAEDDAGGTGKGRLAVLAGALAIAASALGAAAWRRRRGA